MGRILFLVVLLFTLLLPAYAVSKQSYVGYVKTNLPDNAEIIADGVSHIKFYYGGNCIDIFHINRAYNKDIVIRPILSQKSLKGTKQIQYYSTLMDNFILILNCMYFNMHLNYPIGLLKIGDEIYTGSIYNRSALIIYKDRYIISRVGMNIKVNDIVVDNINQPRMSKNALLMYTGKWGMSTPPTPENGVQIKVNNNRVISISKQVQQIPLDGYVLVGPSNRLSSLSLGSKVKTIIDTIPSFSDSDYIVSGGPTVLSGSMVNILATEEKMGYIGSGVYNRTFACITEDNSLILGTSVGNGISLKDEASIMKKFKCVDGMNFDGGTSTSGIYKNGNTIHSIANSKRLLPVVLVVEEKRD